MSIRDDADGAAMGFRSSDNIAKWQGSQPAMSIKATQPEDSERALSRYRFLMALLIDRGVLTNQRYRNGTWSLQGIYGIDDSGLRGAGTTPEEAIDNAIMAARLDPKDQLTHWRETHETLKRNTDAEEGTLGFAALATPSPQPAEPLQERVQPWLMECFGQMIAGDREERNHRFLEEALELVQACGCSASEAHQLVDYTFGRPVGEKDQEVGGVMITLAALCLANGLDMHAAGERELARIWTMVEKIRAKQAAKPKHSPLPEHARAQPAEAKTAAVDGDAKDAKRYQFARSYGGRRVALFTIDDEGKPLDILVGGFADSEIDAAIATQEGGR